MHADIMMNKETKKTTSYDIREGSEADIEASIPLVREFVAESLAEYGLYLTEDHVRETFKKMAETSLVMYDGDRMIGVIAGYIYDHVLTGTKIYQEQIWFVSKEYRRRGGMHLILDMERRLKLLGVEHFVMCHMGNSKSEKLERLFNLMGFKYMESHYIKKIGE